MAETQANQEFEARQSNLVPFPSGTDAATGGTAQTYTVKDIETEFGVANKQARNYAATVKDAYPWLLDELKVGQKYSQLMIEKIREFKSTGLSASEWVAKVHSENPEKFEPQPQPQQETKGELTRVASVEVVPGLSRLQNNLYEVSDFGADRLTLANQNLNHTQANLNLTLDQTREAMKNLALQQYQASLADEAERQDRLNSAYMEAFKDELAIIQAQNMAREDARIQALQLKQAMGKAQSPEGQP